MKYAYFNKESGRVLQWLDTDTQAYNLPNASMLHECTAIEWAFDHKLEWQVSNGRIIPYVEAINFDLLKALKIAEISDAFNTACKAGFLTTLGLKMNTDISDVQRLKSAYDLALLIEPTKLPIVVDYDNAVHVNVSIDDVLTLIKELGINYQNLYTQKQTLRSQAMAATSQSDLDAITWS